MNRILPYKRKSRIDHDEDFQNHSRVKEDKTAWDYYNEKARISDREFVKDWNENLANLLIFAALFSAILTAFIIESMKLLHEDAQDTTNNLLLFLTKQVVNTTMQNATQLAYDQPDFIPKSYVVTINCLFFSSLSLSLLAALASIIILQWVGRYDAGILSYPASKDRALHRQFRYDGATQWRMNEIISALPYLLYFSLVFFFVGIIVWLYNINITVAIVVSLFFFTGIIIYIITTIMAVVSPSAPFRTPLSDLFIKTFYRISPRIREERAINADQGFPLHTLLELLATIEIVAHSYSTLSTVAREIVRQPYWEIFKSPELGLQHHWENIFQAIPTSFSGDAQRQEAEYKGLLCESLADYTVSILVQEAPNAQQNIEKLLVMIPSLENNEDVSQLMKKAPPTSGIGGLVQISPAYLYTIILNWPTISKGHLNDKEILDWLCKSIEIPLEELATRPLISDSAIQSLLTASSIVICSIASKQGLATGPISSIHEFTSIVSSAIDSSELDYGPSVFQILKNLIIYHCARLARTSNSYIAVKIVEDLDFLMIPSIQQILPYFPVYELLFCYSQHQTWPNHSSSKHAFEKLFNAERSEDGNIGLKILVFLDRLMENGDWYPSGAEEDARDLLVYPLFGTGWGWIEPCQYTLAEERLAVSIKDPALRLIASASSGLFLDLDRAGIRGSIRDNLFIAAGAYWIAMVMWGSGDLPLKPGELSVLEVLLSIPGPSDGLSMWIPSNKRPAYPLITRLNLNGNSFSRFDQLLTTCDENTLALLVIMTDWQTTAYSLIQEKITNPEFAMKLFRLLEVFYGSSPLGRELFQTLLKFVRPIDKFPFMETTCFLWADMLEHGAFSSTFDRQGDPTNIASELTYYLFSNPHAALRFRDMISEIIPRQISLRKQRMALNIPDREEDGILEWHLDLGFVPHVAFETEDVWDVWLTGIRADVAMLSTPLVHTIE